MLAICSGVSACMATGAICGAVGGWLVAVAALTNPLVLAAAFGIGWSSAIAIEAVENSVEVWNGQYWQLC